LIGNTDDEGSNSSDLEEPSIRPVIRVSEVSKFNAAEQVIESCSDEENDFNPYNTENGSNLQVKA